MKLNIGCGKEKLIGYINIDISKEVKPDMCHDIEKGIPIESSKADEIICKHVIEHLDNPIKFIEECHRTMKTGANLTIIAPHISQIESIGELAHKRTGISVNTFIYTTKLSQKERNYYSKARFKIAKTKITTHPIMQPIANLSPTKYEKYFSRFFGAREIEITLIKE